MTDSASVSPPDNIAHADSWRLPEVRTYESPNGTLRFTVFPRSLASQLDYFEDTAEGREPAGQDPKSDRTRCRGKLEHREEGGAWMSAWERELVNEVAPVDALVADSGYVVTTDNWYSLGHGPNAVVIYARDDRLVRELGLRDFLTEEEIGHLPHSVSSIHWGRGHHIAEDGMTVVLRVLEPDQDPYAADARFRNVPVRLADGEVPGRREP